MDDNAIWLETAVLLSILFWVFLGLFLISEPGERMSYQYDMFYEELNLCDWYKIPIKMQRIYLIFLSNTLEPNYITCYGNIHCSRDTVKKVMVDINASDVSKFS